MIGGDKFFAKILAHEGFDAEVEVDATENENFLRKPIKERDKLDEKPEDLFYAFDGKNNWGKFSAEQKISSIEKVIGSYAKQSILKEALYWTRHEKFAPS